MSGPDTLQVMAGGLFVIAQASTVVLGLSLAGLSLSSGRLSASARHGLGAMGFASVAVVGAFSAGAVASEWTAVVPVWAAGALLLAAGRLVSELRVRRLAQTDAGLRCPEARIVEADVPVPLTWGVWRPVIALPRGSVQSLSAESLQAVLAHERAHVRRGDWLVQALAFLCCALLWFQPLAWVLHRRLGELVEEAVDDRVLRDGVRPSVYARLLLRYASQDPVPMPGLGPSLVARRVRRALEQRPRSIRRWPTVLLAATAWSLAIPVLASAARRAPAPPPPTCQPSPLIQPDRGVR